MRKIAVCLRPCISAVEGENLTNISLETFIWPFVPDSTVMSQAIPCGNIACKLSEAPGACKDDFLRSPPRDAGVDAATLRSISLTLPFRSYTNQLYTCDDSSEE
jgi:hypothetical protein